MPAQIIVVTPAESTNFITVEEFKNTFGKQCFCKDEELKEMIARASALVEDYCNRKFARQTVREYVKPNFCLTYLQLSQFPAEIEEIKYLDEVVDPDEYVNHRASMGFVDSARGFLWHSTGRHYDYTVEYTYGYVLPTTSENSDDVTLPKSIQQATFLLAKAMYLTRDKHPNAKLEEIPQVYKVAYAGGDLPNTAFNMTMSNDVKMLLQPYRRLNV